MLDTIIRVRRGVRLGSVLSPTLFDICISTVPAKISGKCLSGLADVSYLAYADDLLLISHSKKGLSQMVSMTSDAFSDIGLSLNIDKCEFLPYNCTTGTPLLCNNCTIPLVDCIRWVSISITNNLSSLRQRTVCDISKKIQIGYAKIVANRGKYNRRALANLYSTFCDHSVLYTSGLFPLLKKGNLKRIRINYFKFYKFLLDLPPWTKTGFLLANFQFLI